MLQIAIIIEIGFVLLLLFRRLKPNGKEMESGNSDFMIVVGFVFIAFIPSAKAKRQRNGKRK